MHFLLLGAAFPSKVEGAKSPAVVHLRPDR